MGQNSKIEWCHHTVNPWRSCTKATWTDSTGKVRLHPGCLNCYAEKDRSVRMHGIRWGKGQQRVPKAESGWAEPMAWARAAARAGERHRVFCASLSDVLDTEVPDSMRERLWDTIRKTAFVGDAGPDEDPREVGYPSRAPDPWDRPGLDYLLLTKRPEEWRRIPEDIRQLVWLGTSVSDQDTADEWVPRLLAAQGFRYRFLSVEPLVGPVDLSRYMWPTRWRWDARYQTPEAAIAAGARAERKRQVLVSAHADFIDLAIVGGESGPKARPCAEKWVRDIIRQCREAGTACFVKQMGAVWAKEHGAMTWAQKHGTQHEVEVPDKKGGDWKNWPEDLRVRMLPGQSWDAPIPSSGTAGSSR